MRFLLVFLFCFGVVFAKESYLYDDLNGSQVVKLWEKTEIKESEEKKYFYASAFIIMNKDKNNFEGNLSNINFLNEGLSNSILEKEQKIVNKYLDKKENLIEIKQLKELLEVFYPQKPNIGINKVIFDSYIESLNKNGNLSNLKIKEEFIKNVEINKINYLKMMDKTLISKNKTEVYNYLNKLVNNPKFKINLSQELKKEAMKENELLFDFHYFYYFIHDYIRFFLFLNFVLKFILLSLFFYFLYKTIFYTSLYKKTKNEELLEKNSKNIILSLVTFIFIVFGIQIHLGILKLSYVLNHREFINSFPVYINFSNLLWGLVFAVFFYRIIYFLLFNKIKDFLKSDKIYSFFLFQKNLLYVSPIIHVLFYSFLEIFIILLFSINQISDYYFLVKENLFFSFLISSLFFLSGNLYLFFIKKIKEIILIEKEVNEERIKREK